MKLNKKRWFDTQVLEFEIDYDGYPIYPDNYRIMSYDLENKEIDYCTTSGKPDTIKDIVNYFRSLTPREALFRAREIASRHKKENKQCYLTVIYKTIKKRKRLLAEVL